RQRTRVDLFIGDRGERYLKRAVGTCLCHTVGNFYLCRLWLTPTVERPEIGEVCLAYHTVFYLGPIDVVACISLGMSLYIDFFVERNVGFHGVEHHLEFRSFILFHGKVRVAISGGDMHLAGEAACRRGEFASE